MRTYFLSSAPSAAGLCNWKASSVPRAACQWRFSLTGTGRDISDRDHRAVEPSRGRGNLQNAMGRGFMVRLIALMSVGRLCSEVKGTRRRSWECMCGVRMQIAEQRSDGEVRQISARSEAVYSSCVIDTGRRLQTLSLRAQRRAAGGKRNICQMLSFGEICQIKSELAHSTHCSRQC